MKNDVLEPGLLQILRLYSILALFTLPPLWVILSNTFGLGFTLREHFFLIALGPALFFLYTWSNWVLRRLQRAFLPLALISLSAYTILQKYILLGWFVLQPMRETLGLVMLLSVWIVFQFILLFTAWQYSMAWVELTGIVLCLVDAGLSVSFIAPTSPLYPFFIGIVAARLCAVTGVTLGLVWLMIRQRALRGELADANLKLAQAASTAEQLAASYERNRLARELHDTLAHSLSGVTVELEAVDALWDTNEPHARTMLQQALQNTRSGLTEARRALRELRASPLEDLGLSLAVANLAESVANRSGLQLDLSVPPRTENLSPVVEQCVYRVAQEALTNVTRHANATRVRVALERVNGHIILTVADNGRGFNPAQVESTRYGLAGMRERAEIGGGELEVESAHQQGTTVRLTIAVG